MTKDLTKIKTPFGLLSKKTQRALKKALKDGKQIQGFEGDAWYKYSEPFWTTTATYRVAPEPKPTKPSIDWSAIDKRFKWLSVDSDRCAYVYEEKPSLDEYDWSSNGGAMHTVSGLLSSYQPGTCNSEDSLVQRPEDV